MLMRNSVCLFVLQPPGNAAKPAKDQLVWLHHHPMPSSKRNLAVNFQRAPQSFAASFSLDLSSRLSLNDVFSYIFISN